MPDIATMTSANKKTTAPTRTRSGQRRVKQRSYKNCTPPLTSTYSDSSSSPAYRLRTGPNPKQAASPQAPSPTVHINIGRINIPRSLAPTRNMSTQTDITSAKEVQQAARERAEAQRIHEAKFTQRFRRFAKAYLKPTLIFLGNVFVFCAARVGIGFRVG